VDRAMFGGGVAEEEGEQEECGEDELHGGRLR
jgi:hypothetical protein